VLGIALAGSGSGGKYFLDASQIINRQLHIQCADILLEILPPFGAGNGNDVIPLGQDPGERQLRRRAALLLSQLLNLGDEVEILLKVFSLEPRGVAAVVIRGKIFEAFETSG